MDNTINTDRFLVLPKNVLIGRRIFFLILLTLPFTRDLNGTNLLIYFVLTFFYTMRFWRRDYVPSSMVVFSAISLIYVFFSLFNVFPSVFTILFELKAIPQQSLYSYSLIPAFFLMKSVFCYYLQSSVGRKKLAFHMFSIWIIINCYSMIITGFEVISIPFSIAGLGNTSAIIISATALYLSAEKSVKKRYRVLLIFSVFSFLSPFSQNIVYAIVFFMMWVSPRYSFVFLLGFIVSSIMVYIYFYQYPLSAYFIDSNLFVRLVLLGDAIDGFLKSNLIGVGFGTESLSNNYLMFDNPEFKDADDTGFIHLSVHNSFATIAYRIGVLGFIALIWFVIRSLKLAYYNKNDKALISSMLLAFFIVTFQNPGLESYVYLYGIFIYLSLAWALDRKKSNKYE